MVIGKRSHSHDFLFGVQKKPMDILQPLTSLLKPHLINMLGWQTNRRIIVFESDDWGMVRMASKGAYERLLRKGYPVDKCVYNRNDALESNDDVLGLLEVLQGVKDRNDHYAKFTLNNIVANPDLTAIKDSGFERYYYESFTRTLSRYSQSDQVVSLYKQGLEAGIFQLQLHGREHINVNKWIHSLSGANQSLKDAMEEGMFTLPTSGRTSCARDYLDSFGDPGPVKYESQLEIIKTAMELFTEIWGFKSKSFIAPCYTWSPSLEPILYSVGVKYLQGMHIQRIPRSRTDLKNGRRYHWQGEKNRNGQLYFVRNVLFEPGENQNQDAVDMAMASIANAFRYRKPAIICSHRVNYIGRISPENRSVNLGKLKVLLREIMNNWPDVEFMSSDELGRLMDEN